MEERIARLQAMASTQAPAAPPMRARAGGSVPKTDGRGPWG
jgi:hypothetical protein